MLSFASNTDYSIAFWVIIPIGLTTLVIFLINKSRKDTTFTIGSDFIGVNDKRYNLNDIQKIYIKDPKGNLHRTVNNNGTGFLIGGSAMSVAVAGAASVASSSGRAVSEIIGKAIHKVSFKIEFLYGNKKIALAKGLSENNAIVLFDKVMVLLNKKS